MKFKGIFALTMLFGVGAGSVINEQHRQAINMRVAYYAELEGGGLTCNLVVRRGMNYKMTSSLFFKGLAKTCAEAPLTRKPPSCEDFIENLKAKLLADDTCNFIDQEKIRAQRLVQGMPELPEQIPIPAEAPEDMPNLAPMPAPEDMPDYVPMPTHDNEGPL